MVDWSKYFTYSNGKLFWAYTAKAGRGRVIHYAGEEATGTDKNGYRVIYVSGVGSVLCAELWKVESQGAKRQKEKELWHLQYFRRSKSCTR